MTKIINWVCGSFFRTIGRVIAFLVIGCLVAVIIDKSDIKITDLFNLEVQASTMYGNAFMNNMSLKDGSNTYTLNYRNDGYYAYNLSNVSGEKNYIFKFDTINLNSNIKELTFNIKYLPNYTQYSSVYEYLENTDFTCGESHITGEADHLLPIQLPDGTVVYRYGTWTEFVDEWTCAYESLNSSISGTTTQQNFDFSINVSYIYSNSEWNYTPCYVKSFGGSSFTISCPVLTNNIDGVKVGISATQTHNATIGITSLFTYELDGTTAIIENQNANTNATIENQNQNTQEQIESQQVCQYIDKEDIVLENKALQSNGTINNANGLGITDYINIQSSTIETLTKYNSTASSVCFYNVNKSLVSCITFSNLVENQKINIPNNSKYFRATINVSQNKPTFNICTNGNQALSNTINDTNVSESESEASSFFSSFTIQDHGGLSAIVTAPLQTISNLLSNTCTDLVLPLPYVNENITLPCLSDIYSEHFGAFFTIYQALILALVSYRCLRSLFFDVRGFIDPNDGRIEVLDL